MSALVETGSRAEAFVLSFIALAVEFIACSVIQSIDLIRVLNKDLEFNALLRLPEFSSLGFILRFYAHIDWLFI